MKMTSLALALAVIGVAATAFGAWGRHSRAGRAAFDEMAGIIPLGAFWLGIVLLLIAAILWGIVRARG